MKKGAVFSIWCLQQTASLSTQQPSRSPSLVFKHSVRAPFAKVVKFYRRDDVLEILTPPVIQLKTLKKEPIAEQSINSFTLAPPLIGKPQVLWIARHQNVVLSSEVFSFCDVQEEGPMKFWMHTHEIRPNGSPDETIVIDSLWLEYPEDFFYSIVTRLLFGSLALNILFTFRALITRLYIEILLRDIL
mmetsp:Transcript_13868/g.18520  ORF Transcript_13868/g.18520 Transcript_13868/m.18520 type:complete len:188 (-) Transcript_13868:21-584(-)